MSEDIEVYSVEEVLGEPGRHEYVRLTDHRALLAAANGRVAQERGDHEATVRDLEAERAASAALGRKCAELEADREYNAGLVVAARAQAGRLRAAASEVLAQFAAEHIDSVSETRAGSDLSIALAATESGSGELWAAMVRACEAAERFVAIARAPSQDEDQLEADAAAFENLDAALAEVEKAREGR